MVAAPIRIEGKHEKKLTPAEREEERKSIARACLMVHSVSNKIRADPRFQDSCYIPSGLIILMLICGILLLFGS